MKDKLEALWLVCTTLKDTGKWIAFIIEIWAMVILAKFASRNNYSPEVLAALTPAITALFQTVAILVGTTLGVTKIADKVLDYLKTKNIDSFKDTDDQSK